MGKFAAAGLSIEGLRTSSPGLRIRQLLIVSGPSGAGKSTFLKQLRAGLLPAELLRLLPEGAGMWPQTNGSRIRGPRSGEARSGGGTVLDGLVLHYDFLRVFDTEIDTYSDDPALAAVSLADEITVIVIAPAASHLIHQIGQKPADPGPIGSALKRFERRVRRALRPAPAPVYRDAASQKRHEKLRERYGETGFLESWYARWVEHLALNHSDRISGQFIFVAPVATSGKAPGFSVLPARGRP